VRYALREQITAEVLELGEMLFDTAIDAASRPSVMGIEPEALLVEEMRVAADEFFIALRLLLGAALQSTSVENSASASPIPADQDKDKI
jgi:hypothetical protein